MSDLDINDEQRIEAIENRHSGVFRGHDSLIADVDFCKKLAEYFDIETGGECSPERYVQQAILAIKDEKAIAYHKARLKQLGHVEHLNRGEE